jgi:mono/diheme cytochrome c family protein
MRVQAGFPLFASGSRCAAQSWLCLSLFLLSGPGCRAAPQISTDSSSLLGKELYEKACARCHGSDGKGDRTDIQLDVRLPNFARCAESAEEPDDQWRLIIEKGGVVFGLSPQMPAYGDVLTRAQIDSLLLHMREFCQDRRWVRGELNFQRPLFTEKAYPENEIVIGPRLRRSKEEETGFVWNNILERRIGPRTEVEFALPLASAQVNPASARHSGVGDIEIGVKQVLFSSLSQRFILSSGLEMSLPTGANEKGLGAGTTKFEPFVALGKETRGWVVQGSLKIELPADTAKAEREFAYTVAIGYPLFLIGGVRDLFLTLEVVGNRELKRGERNEVALVPQIRLPIDRMGRWAFAIGPFLPIPRGSNLRPGFAAYLLWEYLGR